jgi:hypothetical protein
MRAALAVLLLWTGAAGAQVLSHRLDSLTVRGEKASEARVVQGELRARVSRGWLRRR